jgi:NAD(P)-dependent dehydrogenase (short-subunit alcohol dehydrogenase family)
VIAASRRQEQAMGILEGKVAIVTGGGRGIGRGHSLELARQGAKVVVNDLGGSSRGEGAGNAAEETVKLIQERGGAAVANFADVADYDAAGQLIQQAHDTFGRFDILVNNAGIVRDAAVWKMAEDDFDKVIRVHVKGSWTTAHHAARYWREQSKGQFLAGRRIINTTSGAGLFGNFGQTNYATAKAAVVGLTLTLAVELHKIGVTANCISPGGMTRITSSIPGFPPPFETNEIPEDQYHRMDPGGSSPVVAWLASDEAQYVSGQIIHSVYDKLTWMKGWSQGPAIVAGDKRWKAEELGAKLSAQVFGVRAAGIATTAS